MKITTLPNGQTIATIEGDTHIGQWAIQSGRLDHDQNMLPLLLPHIPIGGVVIDVGAYIGDHTVFYAEHVGRHGSVVAIEPNPEAFECLAHNVKDMVQVYALNIGASDTSHSVGLANDRNAGATHATQEGNIPCIAIDSLNIHKVDFIKFDCEGMEVKAIKGAQQTIERSYPAMLIEINPGALSRQCQTPEAIFDLLDEMGYLYRNVYAQQTMEGDQYDILCVRSPR